MPYRIEQRDDGWSETIWDRDRLGIWHERRHEERNYRVNYDDLFNPIVLPSISATDDAAEELRKAFKKFGETLVSAMGKLNQFRIRPIRELKPFDLYEMEMLLNEQEDFRDK